MAIGGLVAYARGLPKTIGRWIAARFTVVLETGSNESQAYDYLLIWLSEQKAAAHVRRIMPKDAYRKKERFAFTPGTGVHFFVWQGHPIWVKRDVTQGTSAYGSGRQQTLAITTLGRSQKTARALMLDAVTVANEHYRRSPGVYVPTSGDWRQAIVAPERRLDSVILPEGVAESVVERIRSFQTSQQWYDDRCIPWRLSFCLHGLPGTGKTSLVCAVAHTLRMSIYSAVTSSIGGDATFAKLLADLPQNALLLLEDIDAAQQHRTKTKDEEKAAAMANEVTAEKIDGLTLAGLLNALDGVSTPSGLIMIYTTNHLDRLDPAMLRPGRMDVLVPFGVATAQQGRRMFAQFFVDGSDAVAFGDAISDLQVTTAEIQEHLMGHRYDPLGALASVGTIVARRPASDAGVVDIERKRHEHEHPKTASA